MTGPAPALRRPRASIWGVLVLALSFALGSPSSFAAQAVKKAPPAKSGKPAAAAKSAKPKPAVTPPAKAAALEPVIEARALDLLKAASAKLAAAKSMSFTAVVSYESQSRYGPPLIYTTKSDVALSRPDKLRVITFGDGPPSEFYYNGKVMMAFAPVENLVAVAEAPPTLDAALKAAFDSAAIYFPFTDLIVADPYQGIADGLQLAFYIGQSNVVGGVSTDMVAYVASGVFVQAWIGAEDRLPRRLRAIYLDDPAQLRHDMVLSDWQLDSPLAAEFFESAKAASANRIAFAKPSVSALPTLPKSKPAKSPPVKKK